MVSVEVSMKVYVLSLGAGVLVGVIYSLINVRSPAPPVVALVGLLGMLLGEQIPPLAKSLWLKEPAAQSWLGQIKPHMFGHLPKGEMSPRQVSTKSASDSEGPV
jgi:XapX domain-containing protein